MYSKSEPSAGCTEDAAHRIGIRSALFHGNFIPHLDGFAVRLKPRSRVSPALSECVGHGFCLFLADPDE